jgi:hypothetical protein
MSLPPVVVVVVVVNQMCSESYWVHPADLHEHH